jgi:hypothetical protein
MKKWLRANFIVFIFLFLDSLVVTAHLLLKDKYGFFNLDGEQNLNSTYSGFKLLCIAAMVVIQFLILQKARERFSKRVIWFLVATSFIYLGLDELAMLHERLGFVINNLIGVADLKGASFNWLIYYLPFILVALIVYTRFVLTLWREDLGAAIFILSGVIFFALGLGVEVVSGIVVYPQGVVRSDFSLYFTFIFLEEIIELLGSTLFLTGMFKSTVKNFNLHFVSRSEK